MANQRQDDDELKLSPSERIAFNSATRISGGRAGQGGSTQKALASITLGFELVILFLVGLTLFGLNVFQPKEAGLIASAVLCGLCLLALAVMRLLNLGIVIGWIVQILLFACAIWLPGVLIVALMFGGLWVFCLVKGAQIDRMKAQWAAEPPTD